MKYRVNQDFKRLSKVTTCVVVWIEIKSVPLIASSSFVTTCVVVWIEISPSRSIAEVSVSPPAWWCGLKLEHVHVILRHIMSPPAWWCGLKSMPTTVENMLFLSPPAWWCGLKFYVMRQQSFCNAVTTCVVVWIEIEEALSYLEDMTVTTCVVVWIEIPVVDNKSLAMASPPAWWCGLKYFGTASSKTLRKSPPAWWCGLKSLLDIYRRVFCRHHLRGGVD